MRLQVFTRTFLPVLACIGCAVPLFGQPPESAEPAAEQGEKQQQNESQVSVRLVKDAENQPQALQTSIRKFQSPQDAGCTVDLVGAIHVGEQSYYTELNRLFREYDSVLYELVAPEGTRIPKGGAEPSSAVSYIQDGMTQALGLAFQLESIDYTCGNFVHADMTPEEFATSMKQREESLGKMFFRALGQSLVKQTQQGVSTDFRMLAALVAKNRELELKRVLAEEFSDLDGSMLVFDGPDGSTLVTERNKKALSVLRREIKKGRKRIAIFFGAGHMKDMAKRLESDFQMKPIQLNWITAWDLTEAPAAADSQQ